MASERKFIQKALQDFGIKTFLQRELENAGVSSIEIQKTPIATRIAINVRRPGLVVGKKGQTIKDISTALQEQYHVENPQIEVIEVQNPSLDAKLMAEKIGKQLEIRGNAKTAMRFALREILSAGALGVEITAAGKLVGKGGKAKTANMRAGFLKKSGEESKKLRIGRYRAFLRAGIVGITVKIVLPNTVFSDQVDISKLTIPAALPEQPAQPIVVKQPKKKHVTRKTTAKPKTERKPRAKKETSKSEQGDFEPVEPTAQPNAQSVQPTQTPAQPSQPTAQPAAPGQGTE